MAHKYIECEACAYYGEDRNEQPCCGCVGGCNYESEGGDNGE
jgi:hypothetical protein